MALLSQMEPRAAHCTVLVVDDDVDFCRRAEAMLAALGYTPLTVSSGMSAVAQLSAWRPDVILAEIYMPQFDGIELIHAVREAGSAIPIIAMAEDTDCRFDILTAARALGANAVLHKPFSQADLGSVLGTALGPRH
jgi:CheY-like chemotaxis protein